MNLFGYIQDRMFQKCLRNIRKFKRYFPLQKTLADHRARSLLEQPTSEHEQIQAIYIIYEYGYFIRYEIYIELYQKYNIQYIFFDRVLLRVLLGFVPTLCDCPVFLLITVTKVFVKENVRNYLRNFQFTNVPIFLGHSVYMPRYIGQKST